MIETVNGSGNAPSFIESTSTNFEIFTTDISDAGTYEIDIFMRISHLHLPNQDTDGFTWHLTVLDSCPYYFILNTAPHFVNDLDDVEMEAGTIFTYTLPDYLD